MLHVEKAWRHVKALYPDCLYISRRSDNQIGLNFQESYEVLPVVVRWPDDVMQWPPSDARTSDKVYESDIGQMIWVWESPSDPCTAVWRKLIAVNETGVWCCQASGSTAHCWKNASRTRPHSDRIPTIADAGKMVEVWMEYRSLLKPIHRVLICPDQHEGFWCMVDGTDENSIVKPFFWKYARLLKEET